MNDLEDQHEGSVRVAGRLLKLLMTAGRPLSPPDVERSTKIPRARARRILNDLEREMPQVRKSAGGKGRRQVFWWEWPTAERSTVDSVWALALAMNLLEPFRDSVVGDTLQQLYRSHRDRLPSETMLVGDLDRRFLPQSRAFRAVDEDADGLDRLAEAVFRQNPVKARYRQSKGQLVEIELEPWSLFLGDEAVYVFGLCIGCSRDDLVGQRRVFNAHRFSEVRRIQTTFEYPDPQDYNPRALLDNVFGIFVPRPDQEKDEVVIRVAPTLASVFTSGNLHVSEVRRRTLDDGGLEVTFQMYSTWDFVRWVRGFGGDVQVEAPADLRAWVTGHQGADHLHEMIKARPTKQA